MPAHKGLWPNDLHGPEDRRTPTIKVDEEQAIAVRELDATAYLALQYNQLLSQRGILCFKSALGLEGRCAEVISAAIYVIHTDRSPQKPNEVRLGQYAAEDLAGLVGPPIIFLVPRPKFLGRRSQESAFLFPLVRLQRILLSDRSRAIS